MNTSKQVNVMIGLLFLLVITFGMYFVWDQNVRAERAEDRQAEENAVRGGKLFALNCRICHGDQGLGSQENPNLPGAALNLESYRTIDTGQLRALHQRLFETIRCGRVGTLMPTWGEDQGGTLNTTQMQQLVALITGTWGDEHPPTVRRLLAQAQQARAAGDEAAASDLEAQAQAFLNEISQKGWETALELAHEQDTILTPAGEIVRLARDVGANDTVLLLNDAHIGLSRDQLLRLGPSGEEGSEVVKVVQFPAASTLARRALPADQVLHLESAADFREGTVVQAGSERMLVLRVDAAANTIAVMRGVEGTRPQEHRRGTTVQDPRNQVTVERGAFGTEARPHPAGTQVFLGPQLPPEGPLTGEGGTPPCGQRPPVPQEGGVELTPSPGQPQRPRTAQPTQATVSEPQNGVIEVPMQDNRFLRNNLRLPLGQPVTVRIVNQGQAAHNLRVAGPDGQWNTADDQTVPAGGAYLPGGQQAEAALTFPQAGVFAFRCDLHPNDMWGYITVQQ
jgi:mono/diheme cytochrome c family protein/plastocyanin